MWYSHYKKRYQHTADTALYHTIKIANTYAKWVGWIIQLLVQRSVSDVIIVDIERPGTVANFHYNDT